MSKKLDEKRGRQGKPLSRDGIILLVILIVASVVVFGTYRVLVNYQYFELVLIAYMVIEAAFVFAYLIYNRGLSRRGITADMLPSEWSDEQKKKFIDDGKERLKKSRWMLVVILAFFFTFAIEAVELIVVPFFAEMLGL
ncbi:MAG: hypothetical protein J6A83_08550 [Clostridia bacterium]|nr:hypothetical protein [Clostridia bacterium]